MLVHIIDDDQAMARTVARFAEQGNCETILYASADEFLGQLGDLPYGCIVTDIRMPGTSGTDLIEILCRDRPELPVIMMTGFGELDAAIRSFRHGAIHFLRKPFKRAELISALREAAKVGEHRKAEAERRQECAAVQNLTRREAEVLAALARGLQSKTIAWELGISIRTVEMHRSNILAKLGARNTSQAVGLLRMAAAA